MPGKKGENIFHNHFRALLNPDACMTFYLQNFLNLY